jgi:hypothetical protein
MFRGDLRLLSFEDNRRHHKTSKHGGKALVNVSPRESPRTEFETAPQQVLSLSAGK